MFHSPSHLHDSDAALLEALTGPTFPKAKFSRRDADLDPLMLAAALASGPHVTRNHYHHDFFPAVMMPQAEGAWDWTKWQGEDANDTQQRPSLKYVSQQAPRSVRLMNSLEAAKENDPRDVTDVLKSSGNLPPSQRKRQTSKSSSSVRQVSLPSQNASSTVPIQVKCMARTRIPTSHGPVFLHLYHNNKDDKEHLAIVVDPSQLSNETPPLAPPIRSTTLDAIWNEDETEMDRITRGAYVGRLTPTSHHASSPSTTQSPVPPPHLKLPAPLVRLHSECFTGETVGSMRCDCGEQLDAAIRSISQPITLPASQHSPTPITIQGRGAIIYLRQEGRGIGLLSKIRAYNLQDLGHDTVAANLMLGHQADERKYEIAAAILKDLGIGEGVRLLTNNPDKVRALEAEGVRVEERLPMIPRSWQAKAHKSVSSQEKVLVVEHAVGTPYGEDLDNYLRTKVLRMGHMLPLWSEDSNTF